MRPFVLVLFAAGTAWCLTDCGGETDSNADSGPGTGDAGGDGVIHCGATDCALGAEECCFAYQKTPTCAPLGACPQYWIGLACDESADCAPDERCCVDYVMGSAQKALCRSASGCPASSLDYASEEVCDPADGLCRSGGVCSDWPDLPGVGRCSSPL